MAYNPKQQSIIDSCLAKVRGSLEGNDPVYSQAIKDIINAFDDEVSFTAEDVVQGLSPAHRFEAIKVLKRLEQTSYEKERVLIKSHRGDKFQWIRED